MKPYMDLQDSCYRSEIAIKKKSKHSYNAKLQILKKDDERTSIFFTASSKDLTPVTISG